ncbi:MAG: indolepyruvate ferredoxin oxidoreductase subunit alpha [Acidobacteriia bacterium]|nr:indolepyruvate ferredoxin oxidoreductase subunit alpha [Terriglobia bacterium]
MTNLSESRKILSGNEAIAHAAWAGGVELASAYPGTPSTEILENVAKFKEIYCEWAVNEKVGMEVVIGASFAGARCLTAMKHVGLNVALDPLMTFAYIGANGGMVVVTADDPGMHSSQNEQDNRNIARFGKMPLLEPSDSQDCYDMVRVALDLSEEFEVPVLVRTTTRVSHSSGVVELGRLDRRPRGERRYKKDITRNIPVPMFARVMRTRLEDKLRRLAEYAETSPLERVERGSRVGIVTSGIGYAYAREAFPDASFLKLGMTHPLPERKVREFASTVDRLYVVEEGDPFLEEQLLAMGIRVEKPRESLRIGELGPDRLADLAAEVEGREPRRRPVPASGLPARPPVLCPGCSHRGVFHALHRLRALVTGDIGCYSLGAFAPLDAMDTIVCMGASVTNAHGLEKAGQRGRIAAVIGDSTFFHSGITGLLNMVYNRSRGTVVVLDNRTTAMTGHQQHPGTGRTLMGEETAEARIEEVARGLGVRRVRVVDPYDLEATYQALKEELDAPEPSVVVCRRPCILGAKVKFEERYEIEVDKCTGCGVCLRLGCPAMEMTEEVAAATGKDKVRINDVLCVGCGLCVQVCRLDAIHPRVRS